MYLISGMHRSGTSLVARIFYEAGADMGNPGDFYPPDRWNPDGYFEQPDIHAVNMPLINGLWWKFAYFRLPSLKTIMKRAEKRAVQIEETSARYNDKLVKETRFCLTLPAWLKYGAEIDGIVVCLREPMHVARSLQRRNHIPITLGLKLWYIHNARLLEYTSAIPLWLLNYRDLLNETSFITQMKAALLFGGLTVSDERLESLRLLCVRAHPGQKTATSSCVYPVQIQTLWDALRQRYQQQTEGHEDASDIK